MSEFFDDLMQSLSEAKEMMNGANIGIVHHPVDPKEVRKRANLTQARMAPILGMSLSGYRKLEQGQRGMSGPVANLLRVLDKHPAAVMDALTE